MASFIHYGDERTNRYRLKRLPGEHATPSLFLEEMSSNGILSCCEVPKTVDCAHDVNALGMASVLQFRRQRPTWPTATNSANSAGSGTLSALINLNKQLHGPEIALHKVERDA